MSLLLLESHLSLFYNMLLTRIVLKVILYIITWSCLYRIKFYILYFYWFCSFNLCYILLNSFNMCYILLKVISILFGFNNSKKLYQCYQFIIIDYNNIVLSYIWSYLTILNLTKLEFMTLDILGKNYLFWILDVGIHLDTMNLEVAIKEGNQAFLQDCAKTLIFLHYHLHEGLKNEYLTVKNFFTLWSNLKERYDH